VGDCRTFFARGGELLQLTFSLLVVPGAPGMMVYLKIRSQAPFIVIHEVC